MVSIR